MGFDSYLIKVIFIPVSQVIFEVTFQKVKSQKLG